MNTSNHVKSHQLVRKRTRGFLALCLAVNFALFTAQLRADQYVISNGATNYDAGVSGTHILSSGSVTGVSGTAAIRLSVADVEVQIRTGALASVSTNIYAVNAQRSGLIDNAGLIRGYGGITFGSNAAGSTVRNSGTIIGNSPAAGLHGIYSSARILVDNVQGGVIQSTNHAVWLTSGGTVRNAGEITSTGDAGIRASTGAVLVDNAPAGVITGVNYAIQLTTSGTVLNAGTIRSTGVQSSGVYSSAAATLVSNTNTGFIMGDSHGVHLSSGGTVLNSGTIQSNITGITLSSKSGLVVNSGLVQAPTPSSIAGVYIQAGGTVQNSGTIQGNDGVYTSNSLAVVENRQGALIKGGNGGVFLYGGGRVTNAGEIQGDYYGVHFGNGTVSGTIINSGTISGTTFGIYAKLTTARVTNNTGGLIQGGTHGVALDVGGTVANSGTISGANTGIISAGNPTLVTNNTGGLISGGNNGVYIYAGGTVTNAGTITGTAANSAGVFSFNANTFVSNTTGGLISGVQYGARLAYGGSLTNSGTITSTVNYGHGVSTPNGSAFVGNNTGGLINGGMHGVYLHGGGTVANAGTITGTSAANSVGIYSPYVSALVSNTTGGLVQGGSIGVFLENGGTVANSGTIIANHTGVVSSHGDAFINNTADGLISGGMIGVTFNMLPGYGGTIANAGTISGTGAGSYGVYIVNGDVLVSNTTGGVIQGELRGVTLFVGGTVANAGTISGTGASGVGVWSTSNATLVSNTTGGLIQGHHSGVWLSAGGTVANSGTISGTGAGSYGIYSDSNAALVTNNAGGLIQGRGSSYGVRLSAGGTVINSGTIYGGAGGIFVGDNATLVDNLAGGLIQGDASGLNLVFGGTVNNAGTISGSINYAVVVRNGTADVTNNATGIIDGGVYAGGTTALHNDGAIIGNHGVWLGVDSTLTGTGSIDVTGTGLILADPHDQTIVAENLVRGSLVGVSFVGTGSLGNSGTIIGTGASGVEAKNSVITVTNAATGLIAGGSSGVVLNVGGTVTNFGVISGTNDYAVRVNAGAADVTNNAGATIDGGVYADGSTTLRNDGAIIGNRGVWLGVNSTLSGTGSINVTGTALILADPHDQTIVAENLVRGSLVGVSFAGTGSLGNSGTITGTADAGVEAKNAAITVTNNAGGLISGGSYGINLAQGGTVTNSGAIRGTSALQAAGIYSNSANTHINNTDTGLIAGHFRGIVLDAGGTVTNSGTISGTSATSVGVDSGNVATYISNTNTGLITAAAYGVWLGAGGTIANAGTITGTSASSAGIYSSDGSKPAWIANEDGGLIRGGAYGILTFSGTITNAGTITGTSATGIGIRSTGKTTITNDGHVAGGAIGVSIANGQGGTIDNTGTILGDLANPGSIGIQTQGRVHITNAGYIEGYSTGVSIGANAEGSTILNTGTIRAVMGSDAIVSATSILVTNTAGGLIEGGDIGVWLQGGGTVTNHALITGGTTGIRLNQDGTVANSGTIRGADGMGIFAGGIADITNAGLIESMGRAAVHLTAGGTVANAGEITGGQFGVESVNQFAFVSNTTGGLIEGNSTGVYLDAGGTVTNSGTITGDADFGVYSGDIVVIENTGGVIRGGWNGVWLDQGGRVRNTNSGTILGDTDYGIYSAAGAEIENTGGYVQGGVTGVHVAGTSAITNTGTIIGTGSAGIYSGSVAAVENNGAASLISGGQVGVHLSAGGTIRNAGTILGLASDGVRIDTVSGLVANSGLIEGANDAVELTYGGTVQNSGTLKGDYGVYANRGPAVVENAAGALINATSYAVSLARGGTVANSGTIISAKTGIIAASSATITNESTGLISGGTTGVHLAAGGTIVNSGTIAGMGASGIGVNASGAAVTLTNTTGGVISGSNNAINLTGDAANEVRLWNSSTVAGNLRIVGDASRLTLDGTANTTQLYSDAVTGSTTFTGTLIKQGEGTWTIDKNPGALTMTQQATLVDAGKLIVDWEQYQLSGSAVHIAANATLEVRTADTTGTTTLVNPLTGDGLLDLVGTATVGTPPVTFALDAATGASFSGTVGVGGATSHKVLFDLATSDTALTNAVLKLNANSETTLDANRTIGGLDLNGGTLLVKSDTSGTGLPPYTLNVGNLMAGNASASKIGIDTEVLSGINPPLPPGNGLNQNVFDMDVLPPDGTWRSGTIVHGDTSSIGDGVAFNMVDIVTGSAISSGTSTISFGQNGLNPVGVNTYGNNAIHHTNDSGGGDIVFNYGLISIESVHATEMVILDPTGSLDKTLSAQLTGTTGGAGFHFKGSDTIALAHTNNNYTGATLIDDATWIVGRVTNVIASSTKVTLETADTGFDLGGYDQKLQNLSGAGDIRLGANTLTVANTETGLELSGVIDGAGNLTLTADSVLTLTGENTHTGTTTIAAGAHLQLGNGGSTGMIDDASAVANSGTFTINRSGYVPYGGTVTGTGIFIQHVTGTTTLTGANKIDGGLEVENGALVIGQNDETGWYSSTIATNARVDETAALIFNRSDEVIYDGVISGSGNVATIGSGVLALQKAQAYEGLTMVGPGSTLRTDIADAIQTSSRVILDNSTLDLNNHAQQIQNLTSANGRIYYSTNNGLGTAYTNLKVSGTFEGITTSHMNVDLAGKNTDTLTIQGFATGTHHVEFAPTNPALINDSRRTYALKVVDYVNGDPVFTSNTVESGMYTFQLYKGDGGLIMSDDTAFYLSGGDALSRAGDAILFTAGVMGTDWHYELDSVYKRMGDIRGDIGRDTGSVWARANAYRLNASSALGGSAFEQDTYGLTAGADKVFVMDGGCHLAVGGFLGMTRSDRGFEDSHNDYGDGSSNSISIGAYALLLFDSGIYVDATLKFDRYSNDLEARGVDGFVSRGKYSNNVQGLSVEIGRRLMNGRYWVEPSAQVAVAWINGADYTVSNGVSRDFRVHIGDSDAWQYRLQVRTGANYGQWIPYLKFGALKTDTNGGEVHVEGRAYQPWFDGWRMEAGAGVGYLIDARSQVYFDYEYNKASYYERPWAINLGYRRAW